jgi:hypothetical protein
VSETDRAIIRRRADGQIEIELNGSSIRQLPKAVDALQNPPVAVAEMDLNTSLGLDIPLPTEDQIVAYVKTLPNYQHSLTLISENFLKKPLHASKDGGQNALSSSQCIHFDTHTRK